MLPFEKNAWFESRDRTIKINFIISNKLQVVLEVLIKKYIEVLNVW